MAKDQASSTVYFCEPAYGSSYGQKDMTGAYSEYRKRKFADHIDDPDFWEDE